MVRCHHAFVEEDFDNLVVPHRRELEAHCYRMLGSLQDAEDAVQETLVAAWRGLPSFEGRSSVRTWLYRIATNACLRLAEKRGPRLLSWEHSQACEDPNRLGEPVLDPIWLEPWPSDPAEVLERRETIGLAYVATLQHLPPNQRAVLILREVLAFSAEETAGLLDTSVASVNSALQRARASLLSRVNSTPAQSNEHAALLEPFVAAWEAADVVGLVSLLSEDVRFTMPPLPAWFDGREAVRGFVADRLFATSWRLVPVTANGQAAYACYSDGGQGLLLSGLALPQVHGGRISWIATFVDPSLVSRFGLPRNFADDR